MRSLLVFFKKELLYSLRTGKLLILGGLFLLFGVMNPAIAKLTPLMMDAMSGALAESGMVIEAIEVDAMTSWAQFFKNIPMALIAFTLILGGIFTKEYRSGTLILLLTKGLSRSSVVVSKATLLLVLWTGGYFLSALVTHLGNLLFWQGDVLRHLPLALLSWWLFGIFTVALTVFSSVLFSGYGEVLLFTGGSVLLSYLLSLIPKVSEFLPTYLMNGPSLMVGAVAPEDFLSSILVASVLSAVLLIFAIPIMNRKQL